MKLRTDSRFMIAISLLLFLSACSSGDESVVKTQAAPNLVEHANKSNAGSDAIAKLALADELIAYGHKEHDPLSLLIAAKIMKGIHFKKPSQDNQGSDGRAMMKKKIQATLSHAVSLSSGRKDILGLIEDIKSSVSRGRVNGPLSYYQGTLDSYGETSFPFQFTGGENATVYSTAAEGADVDLIVSDANGAEVCIGPAYSPRKKCSWVPRNTGEFHIYLSNDSRQKARFTLVTN